MKQKDITDQRQNVNRIVANLRRNTLNVKSTLNRRGGGGGGEVECSIWIWTWPSPYSSSQLHPKARAVRDALGPRIFVLNSRG